MNFIDKAIMIKNLISWLLTIKKVDLDYVPKKIKSSKFISLKEAAELLEDGKTAISSGMAGNHRNSIFNLAIKARFEKTGHPRGLTWISIGAQGSKEKVPGSLCELAQPGLLKRVIAGHHLTKTGLLRLTSEKHLEMHAMPIGTMALLLEAMGNGQNSILSSAGKGTFLDPKIGNGSYVGGSSCSENLIKSKGDKLEYSLPPIDYSFYTAPYADEEGNIYFKNGSTYTETREASIAVKKNNGKVIVGVSDIIPKDEKEIFMKKEMVDYIIVSKRVEQLVTIYQKKYWPMFCLNNNEDINESVKKCKFINDFLKITPKRTPAESAIARVGANLFMKLIHKKEWVNIGTGLPEEVSKMVYDGGIYKDITFFTESGTIGGLPAPGSFFGASINPERLTSTTEIFKLLKNKMKTTVLGLLEVDSKGNVNVSRKGPDPREFVGPGGFTNLVEAAENIIFIGAWMARAKYDVSNGEMKIIKPGEYKFIDEVHEITFSGKEALKYNKNVYYVTNVGIFKLTKKGMLLVEIMPGIDLQKDIIDSCPMKVNLPDNGNVPIIDKNIVSGENFELKWPDVTK